MSFGGLAFLLMPAEPGRTGTVVEADGRWTVPAPPDPEADVVLWGRGPASSGTRLPLAARSALARERALRAIRRRPFPSFRLAGLHRLPPPVLAGGPGRNRLRAALLGGAIAELWGAEQVRRVIDAVAEEADAGTPVTRFTPGSGGSAVVRLRRLGGGEALLRAARSDDPGDPRRAAQALAALEPLGLRQVPRLLARGTVAEASWTTESVLPGRRPGQVSAAVSLDVAGVCAALPRSERPATAHEGDLRAVGEAFPRWATVVAHLADEVNDVAGAVPSVARHGDLWAGNLLVRRRRLSGIIDWDGWHPSALPGIDLLHLVAMDQGLRARRGLGQTWLGRPWTGEEYRSVTAGYWTSMRIVPNARFLEVVGIAWWASQVAAGIHRLPHLAERSSWVASNVDRVLEAVGGPG